MTERSKEKRSHARLTFWRAFCRGANAYCVMPPPKPYVKSGRSQTGDLNQTQDFPRVMGAGCRRRNNRCQGARIRCNRQKWHTADRWLGWSKGWLGFRLGFGYKKLARVYFEKLVGEN